MRFRMLAGAMAVLALMLVTSAVLAKFPEQSVGQGSSDIWVVNLHDTEDANVVASYVDQDGNPDSSIGATIDPLGNTSFPADTSGLGNDWLGSMVLFSDKELASVAELYWRNVPKGDGWSGAAYRGYSEGSNEILLPGVAKTRFHRSIITVQCVDTVDCEITMTYRDRDGVLVSGGPWTETIEPDSQETFDLHDATLNPNIPALPTTWYGSVQVTSGQEIAGVVVTHWSAGYAVANNGLVPGDGTVLYFTSINRRNFGGSWGGQSDWTGFSVQNINTYPISAHVSIYGTTGGPVVLTFSDTVPALSNHTYNLRYCGNIPSCSEAYLDGVLGTSFLGTAVVTSPDPIVGAASGVRVPSGGLAGGYIGESDGSNKLVYPAVFRVKDGPKFVDFTAVTVLNIDPNDSVDVTVKFMNSDGTVGVQFGDTIPPNTVHGYNTKSGGSAPGGAATFEALGDSWAGSVIITTDDPSGRIVGVASNQSLGPVGEAYSYMSVYNAVPQ